MSSRASVNVRIADALAAPAQRKPAPNVMVIFGASGDLTKRKLVPALFHLHKDGLLPDRFSVVGVAREKHDDASFRAAMRTAVADFGSGGVPEEAWTDFAQRLFYVAGSGDDPATYGTLGKRIEEIEQDLRGCEGRLYYLAIPPSLYAGVIARLAESGIAPRIADQGARPWVRVIVEKPFGRDLASATALNAEVRRAFAEHQVYRIDHYLGKETVQNLLVFRFANSIFEPLWNRQHVHHVQITAVESVGVEQRGRYYEEAGIVRDMFQNHLLQLLTLTAMEPPVRFNADAVRDEKVKVLRAIRPLTPGAMDEYAVRGQYGPGMEDGRQLPGYREEPNVAPDSATPTYAAVRFMVDNWRWQNVPFYLRSAKRMPRRATEIAIQFRTPPHLMFALPDGGDIAPNVLAIRVQPDEGIALRFEVKVPGVEMKMVPVDMEFDYKNAFFGAAGHEAYETLLLDCMLGEATLFTRADEIEAAWSVIDPLTKYWESTPPERFPNYDAGSWGPAAADELIGRVDATWRKI